MEGKYTLPKDGGLIESTLPRDLLNRYEKMPTQVFQTEAQGVTYLADMIVQMLNQHNAMHGQDDFYEDFNPFVLGLTTGRTPTGLYRELVKRHEQGEVSFRNVAVVSLDEFYPIAPTEPQSRNFRIFPRFLCIP